MTTELGRPRTGRNFITKSVQMRESDWKRLLKVAKRDGVSMAHVIRGIIEAALNK